MAASERYLSAALHCLLLLLLLHSGDCCPAPNMTDAALLASNPHLRVIFNQYATPTPDGDRITPQGIRTLLLRLGLTAQEGPTHQVQPSDPHLGQAQHSDDQHASESYHPDSDPHLTHDHNPEPVKEQPPSSNGVTSSTANTGVGGNGSTAVNDSDATTVPPSDGLGGTTLPSGEHKEGNGHHDHGDGHRDHDHGGEKHDHSEDHGDHDHSDGHHDHDHDHDHGDGHHAHDNGDDHGHHSSADAASGPAADRHLERWCGSVSGALSYLALPPTATLSPSQLYSSCPALLYYVIGQSAPCSDCPGLLHHILSQSRRCYPHAPQPMAGHTGEHPVNSTRPVVGANRQNLTDPHLPAQPYRTYPHTYEPNRDRLDPNDPRYDPNIPRHDPNNPRYEQHRPRYNPDNPGYDPNGYGLYTSDRDGHYTRTDSWDSSKGTYVLGTIPRGYDPTDGRYPDSNNHAYGTGDRGYNTRPHSHDSSGRQYPRQRGQGVVYHGPRKEEHNYEYDDYENYHYDERDDRRDGKESIYARWVGGVVSMILIGCISLACTMVLPALRRSRHYDQANHFLLSLAVGTLAGDALIHLLPHAISMAVESQFTHSDHNDHDLKLHEHGGSQHFKQALYGFTALMGIIIFLSVERLHNIRSGGKGRGHAHGAASNAQDRNSSLPTHAGGILLSETSLDVVGLPPSRKIGKKLSEHSKEDTFNAVDVDAGDPSRCFGSCPPQNLPSSDANGNNDTDKPADNCVAATTITGAEGSNSLRRDQVLTVRRQPLKDGKGGSVADLAERERLMSPVTVTEKLADQSGGDKSSSSQAIPSDSGSVNIVLQEYHVSHHGHSHHGHSHVSGRKDSLRNMILMGEGMHIFMDGMAIGAAFGTSLTGGIATAIAVLCHELPHKVGDFALLFDMGMTRRTALKMVLLMWVLSVVGMVIGELVGSIDAASPWIYSFTAGVFLHLALVDLLSEVSVKDAETCSAGGQILLQICGMLVGAAIMLVIAIYEHDLHNLLAKAF